MLVTKKTITIFPGLCISFARQSTYDCLDGFAAKIAQINHHTGTRTIKPKGENPEQLAKSSRRNRKRITDVLQI